MVRPASDHSPSAVPIPVNGDLDVRAHGVAPKPSRRPIRWPSTAAWAGGNIMPRRRRSAGAGKAGRAARIEAARETFGQCSGRSVLNRALGRAAAKPDRPLRSVRGRSPRQTGTAGGALPYGRGGDRVNRRHAESARSNGRVTNRPVLGWASPSLTVGCCASRRHPINQPRRQARPAPRSASSGPRPASCSIAATLEFAARASSAAS